MFRGSARVEVVAAQLYLAAPGSKISASVRFAWRIRGGEIRARQEFPRPAGNFCREQIST